MTDQAWETLSNQAIAAAGVVYFLSLLVLPRAVGLAAQRPCRAYAGQGRRRCGRGSRRARVTTGLDELDRRGVTQRAEMTGRLGLILLGLACALHFVSLVGRGMAADPNRVPWGNMYEFTVSGTFVVALIFLLGRRRLGLDWAGPLVAAIVLTLLMIAVIWLYDPVAPLTEALNSYWLVIHVVSAVIATGAFTLGGLCSVLYLVKERKKRQRHDRLPLAGARARCARPGGLPAARLRLPRLDLRGADHRADLGPPGLVVVLELGSQGGLGVHHLGRLRRLPPRPRDGGLARAATRPTSRCSAWPRCGSTSSASTTSPPPASTPTPPARPRSPYRSPHPPTTAEADWPGDPGACGTDVRGPAGLVR